LIARAPHESSIVTAKTAAGRVEWWHGGKGEVADVKKRRRHTTQLLYTKEIQNDRHSLAETSHSLLLLLTRK
jgi:hypothetical protein